MKITKEEKLKLFEESDALLKALYWFFAYPNKEIGLSDLAKETGVSKVTANRVVAKLIEEEFLEKEILGKTWRISCNLEHRYNLSVKVPFHLTQIYEKGVVDTILKKIPNAKATILFGSYRKGDDNNTSDIDIAVEITGDEEPKTIQLGILEQIGYRKNVPVQLHIFSRNKVDLNLFSNISNGIVLSGFLEAHP